MDRTPAILSTVAISNACRAVGLARGDVVLVHVSLSRLGYVASGAETMVRALLDVVGPEGRLMAPAQTSLNLDPSRDVHELPEAAWPALRDALPGFDAPTTPSVGMGAAVAFGLRDLVRFAVPWIEANRTLRS